MKQNQAVPHIATTYFDLISESWGDPEPDLSLR